MKSKPNPWQNCTNVSVNEFDNALAKPLHNDITVPIRQYIQANNYISNEQYLNQINFCTTSDNKLRQTNMFIAVNLDFPFKSNF